MALLFGSLPLASRLFLGAWDFAGAGDLGCLCLILAIYLHIVGRRRVPTLPDPSSMLDEANRLAASGRADDAVALLTEAIRLSPQLWQAYQYRGELYLRNNSLEPAAGDFSEAITLAPREPHLYAWRGYARTLLGDLESAQRDYDIADALSGRAKETGSH
jgi:tetratricopeptide (TPR) repeat protein